MEVNSPLNAKNNYSDFILIAVQNSFLNGGRKFGMGRGN
jgi:hypothetical protein